jgi:hypothetical protein
MLVVQMSAIQGHRDRDVAIPLSASTELASRCGSGRDEDNNAEEHSQVLAEELNTLCDVTSCYTISLCRILIMQRFSWSTTSLHYDNLFCNVTQCL